jgi:hypothetical protein
VSSVIPPILGSDYPSICVDPSIVSSAITARLEDRYLYPNHDLQVRRDCVLRLLRSQRKAPTVIPTSHPKSTTSTLGATVERIPDFSSSAPEI